MNEINIDISENNYFYYEDPFDNLIGDNEIFSESEDGGLVLNNFSGSLSKEQIEIISAISEFYKCLHKKYKIVNQDNLCCINKELFEKFKPLQNFIFRKNKQSPIENKINYWVGFRKKWYYWLLFIFIFGELRLHFLKKRLPEHKSDNNLDDALNNFFSKLKPLRCFYSTMDMLAPKDFEAKNISVNELLLKHKNIFKFKIITPQENGVIQSGMVSLVHRTKFGDKNYFYKKMDVLEKVPDTRDEEKLTDKQKQSLSMGNYHGANENDVVIVDPIFRQLAMPIIAEHFGFDNVIPTEIAFLREGENLEPVCLMEEAKGKIGYQIFFYCNEASKECAENCDKKYDIELVDASDPDLQIEALKLAIVDCIGLNLDRHAGNMFLHKTKDGKFKFTAIDNDWVCLLKPNFWYSYNLSYFFTAKFPLITSNLKAEVLSKLNDTDGIEKLLAKLEGKINRGPGGKKVVDALKERINCFKGYIDKECKIIDELNSKTAERFLVECYVTTDNPISAMMSMVQELHSEKLLEKTENPSAEENNKPKTITDETNIIKT